ncbi:MAG: N-acetylmuramoyl-L-alanine amidase [Candidatus Carbobacillus altaicus]|uniref:N-acetylmuramoyl-L-alanine amidase n=1 Tax=Candidatus Carbonibacillus altaicus TaxID=2163959 RepID=A0A2R6Y2Q9_9BACL|nr:MAG: N-acetylmuramoyl-L-alanine amidase [Candidatus Carbobacillus altaicus]
MYGTQRVYRTQEKLSYRVFMLSLSFLVWSMWVKSGLPLFTQLSSAHEPIDGRFPPLSGLVIAIDPGHGGIDGGAVGYGGLIEKNLTLSIALKLRDYLQQAGAVVIMTREKDDMLSDGGGGTRKQRDMRARMKIINQPGVNLAISIHLNSIPSPRWHGAETFYHPERQDAKALAEHIQKRLKAHVFTDRAIKSGQDLFILRMMEPVGVLVEAGYLSHPEEARKLADPVYQSLVAYAIYEGILDFWQTHDDEMRKPQDVP